MNITKIIAYAYYGGQNYQVDLPLILDTEIYNNLVLNADAYNHDWQDLHVTGNPGAIINTAFGKPVYSGNIPFYFVITSENNWASDDKDDYYRVLSLCGLNVTPINASHWDPPEYHSIYNPADQIISLTNGIFQDVGNLQWGSGGAIRESASIITQVYARCFLPHFAHIRLSDNRVDVYLSIWPEDILLNGTFNPAYDDANTDSGVHIRMYLNNSHTEITRIRIDSQVSFMWPPKTFKSFLGDVTVPDYTTDTDDPDNPYGENGTSGPGGGDGDLPPEGLDEIDPTVIPDVPTLDAADAGFISIYNPSVTDLKALSNFMWSGAFDLDTYKKLFSDPMESIIGLAIVPVAPTISGSKNVMFGTIDSGVNMPTVGSQYVKLDCGSVNIKKYVGSFLDAAPYVKISIYLPYIGFRELSPDDLMGGSINVQYIIDVLSGACACFIAHSTKGVLYTYNGSCISNIPLTAANFSGAIQNAITAVVSAAGVVAGAVTGAAPLTAMSASSLINSAANTACNSKPQIQRSGNLGGSAGIMSVQKPFIVIERPKISVPNHVQNYIGQTSNITANLGGLSGFTIVEYCHIEGVPCTTEELMEIESLLKGGVIL